jgi:hypothetical protein
MGQPEEAIVGLAFRHGRLCFPSLLHKCGRFEIASEFDLWVCGQYGLENWLRQTGFDVTDFPCIQKVGRRFLRPEHVRLVLRSPRLVAEACKGSFGLIPVFEFLKDVADSQLSIDVEPPNGSLAFWFCFREGPLADLEMCVFHAVRIHARGEEVRANGELIARLQLHCWYHLCITVNERAKAHVIVDGTERCVVHGAVQQVVTFGGGGEPRGNEATWAVGGAIRLFRGSLHRQTIDELIQSGVSDIDANAIMPSTFVEAFGDIKVAKELAANARPVVSFPLAKHIAITYGGGKWIFDRILELLPIDRVMTAARFWMHSAVHRILVCRAGVCRSSPCTSRSPSTSVLSSWMSRRLNGSRICLSSQTIPLTGRRSHDSYLTWGC